MPVKQANATTRVPGRLDAPHQIGNPGGKKGGLPARLFCCSKSPFFSAPKKNLLPAPVSPPRARESVCRRRTRSSFGPCVGWRCSPASPRLASCYLPVDRILVPLQGVVDSRAHAGRHDIGVRGVGSVVLAGVQRRPMVQVVHGGDRPRGVRVAVHGRRHPYSVHPAVMRQLIVLSAGRTEGRKEGRKAGQRGGRRERTRARKRERERESGRGIKNKNKNHFKHNHAHTHNHESV